MTPPSPWIGSMRTAHVDGVLARGFTGTFQTRQEYRLGWGELCDLLGWSGLFITLRLNNATQLLGHLVTGIFQ